MDGTNSYCNRSQRLLPWLLVVALAAIFAGMSGKFLRNCPNSDWGRCFVRSALRLQAGETLYRPEKDAYTYPPAMAMFALPLANLPARARDVGWYLVNVAAACAALAASWRMAGAPGLRQASARWHVVFWLGMALGLRYFVAPLENTQFDMVIAAVLLVGCCRQWLGGDISGGALIGAAAAMKCTPLLFLPYLVWRRRWRAALAMTASMVLLLTLPDLLFPLATGESHLVAWYSTFLRPLSEFAPGVWHTGSRIELNQSLGSLFNRWAAYGWPLSLAEVAQQRAAPAHLADELRWITYGAAAGLLLLTALRLGWPWRAVPSIDAAAPRPLEWPQLQLPLEAGMGVCLMLLLSPMSSKAHYVVLILPALLLARRAVEQRTRGMIVLIVCLALLGPLSSKDLLGVAYGNLVLFWGFPTLFVLLCWGSLWWLHRQACGTDDRAHPRTVHGEGDRHILLPRHRKMSQSPTVLG